MDQWEQKLATDSEQSYTKGDSTNQSADNRRKRNNTFPPVNSASFQARVQISTGPFLSVELQDYSTQHLSPSPYHRQKSSCLGKVNELMQIKLKRSLIARKYRGLAAWLLFVFVV